MTNHTKTIEFHQGTFIICHWSIKDNSLLYESCYQTYFNDKNDNYNVSIAMTKFLSLISALLVCINAAYHVLII